MLTWEACMFATDRDSERATDIDDYRRTCSEFIIDISRNYGINKMAEFTAGYPFKIEVLLNQSTRYAFHEVGKLKVNVKATPKIGSLARIGNYHKDQLFLLDSSC